MVTDVVYIVNEWCRMEGDWQHGRAASPSCNDMIRVAERAIGLAAGQDTRTKFNALADAGASFNMLATFLVNKLHERDVQLTLDTEEEASK